MKKTFYIVLLIITTLIIGRNLTFLPKFSLFSNSKNATEQLKKDVGDLIARNKGNYAVYFLSLSKDNSFGINQDGIYTAASVNKVSIVAVLYYLAAKNKIDLDEKVTIQQGDIQDYGTGILRYEKPGGVYSLRYLSRLALQKSDNTAAYVLLGKIGNEMVHKTIKEWGLTQTNIPNNKTSLTDTAILFQKIYNQQVTTSSLTKELLGFLTDTDIEDRLPKLIKENTVVYHKTGDDIGTMHDVGIIKNKDTVFFLGILTSDIGDSEKETQNTIAEIAKKVFDFEMKQM